MDESFKDIPISDLTITLDVRTVDGRRLYSSGIEYSAPLPLALYGIWALKQGIPVGIIGLAEEQGPAPYADCYRIMIATDERAMWGRKCPHCNSYWRTAGAGLSGMNVCCYCGKHSEAFKCLSDAQQAYVKACCAFYTQVIESGKDGRCTIKISDLIAQAMASEDGQAAAPPEFFVESQRQTRFTCEACSNLNDVLGRFAWCSSCGTRNDGEMLRQDILTIKAALIANGSPVSALKEAVDAFDAVGRNLARQLVAHVPMTKTRRERWKTANFQQVEVTARNLKADFDIDILEKMDPEAIAEIRLRFHRRHLHAHRGGVVDRKYTEDTGDNTVQVGQLVTESRDKILAFLPRVLKIGDNLLKGFHSVIPVKDDPIRNHREKTARMERYSKENTRGPTQSGGTPPSG